MPTWTKEVVDLSVAGSSLAIDDIKIDGANIGHTDDTDLMALSSGTLTINGSVRLGNTNNLLLLDNHIQTTSGNLTLDSAGAIALDADNGYHYFLDSGSIKLTIANQDPGILFQVPYGDLNMDVAGDILLDAAGADLKILVGGTAYLHYSASGSLQMYSVLDQDDKFSITVGANGETTLSTLDDDGSNADLNLEPNGDLVMAPLDGIITFGADPNGEDVRFFGGSAGRSMLWDYSENALQLMDLCYLTLGTDSDLKFYFSGGASYMTGYTGNLFIEARDTLKLLCASGEKVEIGHTTSTVEIRDDLDVTGNISTDGNLTFTEAATITLKDNEAAGLDIGSPGATSFIRISTNDTIETLTIDCGNRLSPFAAFPNINLDGAVDVSSSLGTTSTVGGIRFQSVAYTNTSGTNTINEHAYFEITAPTITNTSGTCTITDTVLFRSQSELDGANALTTDTDKTGNAKSGTIKVSLAGTIYHLQLYAN